MKSHFRVLDFSLIDSYPTNHMGQIKMEFHRFDSPTAICKRTNETALIEPPVCDYTYFHCGVTVDLGDLCAVELVVKHVPGDDGLSHLPACISVG